MEKELLTAREVAALLSLSLDYVYRLYQTGVLPGRKLGQRSLRFHRQDVEVFARGIEATLPPAQLTEAVAVFTQQARLSLAALRSDVGKLQNHAAEEFTLRRSVIASYAERFDETARDLLRAVQRLEQCAQNGATERQANSHAKS